MYTCSLTHWTAANLPSITAMLLGYLGEVFFVGGGFVWLHVKDIWVHLKSNKRAHPRVCRSTPLCRFRDRHTPACSRLSREVSSKCPQFCKTFHPHGSGLEMENALSLLCLNLTSMFHKMHLNFEFAANRNCHLTCNRAANFAPTRADTGAVPDHPVLWSLVCFPNLVCLEIVLIITGFLN